MPEEEDIRRYSRAQIDEMIRNGEDRTSPDAPQYEVDEEFWANARLVQPGQRIAYNLLMDQEVFAWFEAQGEHPEARMSDVLRAYMVAHKQG